MPSDAARRYYEKNREVLLAKMRERDADRRADRAQYLLEHPEEVELERERMRDKYHNWTANKCKRQMEAWIADPQVKDEIKAFFRLLIADDKYKTMKPKALMLMVEPLNLTASILA
jgi:hypothetical protein